MHTLEGIAGTICGLVFLIGGWTLLVKFTAYLWRGKDGRR